VNIPCKLLSPPVLVGSTRFSLYAITKVSRKPKHSHFNSWFQNIHFSCTVFPRSARVLVKQESCTSVPSESCVSTLKQVHACNTLSHVSTSSKRCVFTLKETHNLAKQQSRVFSTKRSSRPHLEVCITSTKWELRLHFNVLISPMNESRVSTSDEVRVSKATQPSRLQDLCSVFTSVISSNSTLTKAVGDFLRFNSTPTTSSEYRLGLDCISEYLRRSSLVDSKNLTVHSQRPKSRQGRTERISEGCQFSLERLLPKGKSKVFRKPFQPIAEFWKLWRGFYWLSKNHWG